MTVKQVKFAIYSYGIYPALFILKENELSENYENCKIIKDAIDEVLDEILKTSNVTLNKELYNDSIYTAYNNMISESNKPEIIGNNMNYYIDNFRKIINK